MRFILIPARLGTSFPSLAHYFEKMGLQGFRATHVGDGRVVDMFFWATDEAHARQIVLRSNPEATFAEPVHQLPTPKGSLPYVRT